MTLDHINLNINVLVINVLVVAVFCYGGGEVVTVCGGVLKRRW